MSLIVAVKDGDRYVLGADKQCSAGGSKDHNATKIWEVEKAPGIIMGGVGSVRASQIIQYSDVVDLNCLARGLTTEFISRSLVPEIVAALEINGISCQISPEDKTKYIPNVFLFAVEDKAWAVWNDLSVVEIEDSFAIGSGSEVATGALYATKDKNPFERIVTCIEAASESTLYVDDGIDLLATRIDKKDIKTIAKALDVPEAEVARSALFKKELARMAQESILEEIEKRSKELHEEEKQEEEHTLIQSRPITKQVPAKKPVAKKPAPAKKPVAKKPSPAKKPVPTKKPVTKKKVEKPKDEK